MKRRTFVAGLAASSSLSAPIVWTGAAHAQAVADERRTRAVRSTVNAAGLDQLIQDVNSLPGNVIAANGSNRGIDPSTIRANNDRMRGGFPAMSDSRVYGARSASFETSTFFTRERADYNFCSNFCSSGGASGLFEGPILVAIAGICVAVRREIVNSVPDLNASVISSCLPYVPNNQRFEGNFSSVSGSDVFLTETTRISISYNRHSVSQSAEAVYRVETRSTGSLVIEDYVSIALDA